MSDNQNSDAKRVSPSDSQELNDEALESVAGGCQVGCSNADSCANYLSGDKGIKGISIDTFGSIGGNNV